MNTSRNCKVWHRVSRVGHQSGTIKAACGTGKPLSGVRWKTGKLVTGMSDCDEICWRKMRGGWTGLVSLFLLTRPWFCLPNPITHRRFIEGDHSSTRSGFCYLSWSLIPMQPKQGRENVKGTDTLLNEKCSEEVRNKISGLFKVAWLPSV